NEETAENICSQVIENRLIACANIINNLRSIFRWQGKIEKSSESLAILKTTKENFPQLRDFILKAHPYQVPEIISLDISDAYEPYLKWMLEAVTDEI
ncbi:MAG TPA: divalent-cation tolerance protein CutA, partial [Candidatus Marinimicrobia bacterium]|nr:divalent-cation tolerance protein CutA [Candidatus Neomarinimicrobiota bacterium]